MQFTSEEHEKKLTLMRALLDQHEVDGLLLRRVSSFAWATCGASSYVNTATSEGAASLVITREHAYLITNNIEAVRLQEESRLGEQGWEFRVAHWTSPLAELEKLAAGLRLIADVPFGGAREIGAEMSRLRANLTSAEQERFRQVGLLCAQAMTAAAMQVRPGMSEMEIAGLLGSESQKRGVQPIVNLIATDERIYQYRHPLPTDKKLEKYAMLVLSGRKYGLVCSITRLIHFGEIPADVQERIRAAASVNAVMIARSRPGRSLAEIFRFGQQAYAAAGFPDEWRFHHQGGAAGYEPREFLALPGSQEFIAAGQAYAWNPSIAGAKMEDTILIGTPDNQILTPTPNWPNLSVPIPDMGCEVSCPLALEIN
jgi:antitoxin VapB